VDGVAELVAGGRLNSWGRVRKNHCNGDQAEE